MRYVALSAFLLAACGGPDPDLMPIEAEEVFEFEPGVDALLGASMDGDYVAVELEAPLESPGARRVTTETSDAIYFDAYTEAREWVMVRIDANQPLEALMPEPGKTVVLRHGDGPHDVSGLLCSQGDLDVFDASADVISVSNDGARYTLTVMADGGIGVAHFTL